MRLGIQGAWVADNLRRLGSGAFYHLAYATRQVHEEILQKLHRGALAYGRVEIFLVRDGRGMRVADGEVIAVHWFPEFIRVHFMIGRVYTEEPPIELSWEDPDHLVLPSLPSAAGNRTSESD